MNRPSAVRCPEISKSALRRVSFAGLLLGASFFFACPSLALAHDPAAAARVLRFQARLDGDSVVRPPEFRPPVFGTGSAASGWLEIDINTVSGVFSLKLDVEGIDPADLDASHGGNGTAIHIHSGGPAERGPFLLDVHHFARATRPGTDGIEKTATGFRLDATGSFDRFQGFVDAGVELPQLIDLLRSGRTFIAVHTTTNDLYRAGEIRGNLELVPERLRFEARVDGDQVVRPPPFQPPVFGSGSEATGTVAVTFDTRAFWFTLDLGVDGIDPAAFDSTHGPNATAIHLHTGGPEERGDFLLDVHWFARTASPSTDGIEARDSGFSLHAEGILDPVQGALDTGLVRNEVVHRFLHEEVYLAVHTTTNDLFRTGEIRGNLKRRPREIRVRAALDESQVPRPPAFQPPALGTGSAATGTADLTVDVDSGRFTFELDVDGIDPAVLDNTHGANGTAAHVHWGIPGISGPIFLDVHHFARELAPDTNGIVATDDGFTMHAQGFLTRIQGGQDTNFAIEEVLGFLAGESAYITIHTTTNELYRSGEIRGNFRVVPDTLRFEAPVDGKQVVRPPEFQPPAVGSGSSATGTVDFDLDARSGDFEVRLEVNGIDPDFLDASHGPNATAIHLHAGGSVERGPFLLDLHHFARALGEHPDGIERTADGFRLRAAGVYSPVQGGVDSGFVLGDAIDLLLAGKVYVAVHTTTNDLFRSGEVRGNLARAHEELVLSAYLGGEQIVRPLEFQPPLFGSGSDARGVAELTVDLSTNRFEFFLEVEGIDPATLDNGHGDNSSAVRILRGSPNNTGPVILDVHQYARAPRPGTNGVTPTENGFRLEAAGLISQVQFREDVGFRPYEILEDLRSGTAYVIVHTDGSDLFRQGEIRGQLHPGALPVEPRFIRGDCNGDGNGTSFLADAIFLLSWSFLGATEPTCLAACDMNGDGHVGGEVADAVYILVYSFLGGPAPPLPFPECGLGELPSDEVIGCASPPAACL